jgi:hypothetical protein
MNEIKPIVGVLAVGRNTFDVPYAEDMLSCAWDSLMKLRLKQFYLNSKDKNLISFYSFRSPLPMRP